MNGPLRVADTAELVPLSRWARMPLALAAGMVMALGMSPFDLWAVGFLGLLGAMLLFSRTRAGHFAGTGWAVGLGYFGLSLGWIVEPFMVDAALTGWMAPFALFGLAGGLALFWAVAFWAAGRTRFPLIAIVVLWSAAELARAYVLTGFPWGMVSYLWLESPVIQWVSVLGPHGLTVATLGLAALCVAALRGGARRALAALTGAAVLFGGGLALTPAMQDLTGRPVIRLVQPNAAQSEKWDPEMIPVFFNRQLAFSSAPATGAPPALVVWPETALPALLERASGALQSISEAAGVPVAIGVQRSEAGQYFNALAQIDSAGQVTAVYDKHHLVPFGEYMPARSFWSLFEIGGLAARAQGGYTAGPGPRVMDFGALGKAVPLICYEAVFPQDVGAVAQEADWLLQVTNDAWFGAFSGPYQHLAQARIRAIEQGLAMVRVANTGVSAVIDGAGRVLAGIPLGEAGYVDKALPPRVRSTIYSHSGDLPVGIVLVLASLAIAGIGRGRPIDRVQDAP